MNSEKRIAITTVCLVILGYLGIGAFEEMQLAATVAIGPESPPQPSVFDGIPFESKQARHVYVSDLRRRELYPWAVNLPTWQAISLLAIVAGFIGGFIRELHSRILTKKKIILLYPIMGICVSLLVGALLLLIPKLLFVDIGEYRPEVVFAFCMLSGCFSEETWEFVRDRFSKFGESAS